MLFTAEKHLNGPYANDAIKLIHADIVGLQWKAIMTGHELY